MNFSFPGKRTFVKNIVSSATGLAGLVLCILMFPALAFATDYPVHSCTPSDFVATSTGFSFTECDDMYGGFLPASTLGITADHPWAYESSVFSNSGGSHSEGEHPWTYFYSYSALTSESRATMATGTTYYAMAWKASDGENVQFPIVWNGTTFDDVGDSCDSGDTRICDLVPVQNDHIVAEDNMVDFSLDLYISADDLSSGFYSVWVSLESLDSNGGIFLGPTSEQSILLFDEYISEPGTYNFSTSTYQADGNYSVQAKLKQESAIVICTNHAWGVCASDTMVHTYYVNTETVLGHLTNSMIDDVNTALGNVAYSTTTAITADSCNLFADEFGVVKCMTYLFVPSRDQVAYEWLAFHDYILSIFPIGYITRFIDIVSDDSPVEPPDMTYTFGRSSPADLQGLTYSINIFDEENINKLATIYADNTEVPDTKNIWDIIMPYLTTLFVIGAFIVMFHDLSGLDLSVYGYSDLEPIETAGDSKMRRFVSPIRKIVHKKPAKSIRVPVRHEGRRWNRVPITYKDK